MSLAGREGCGIHWALASNVGIVLELVPSTSDTDIGIGTWRDDVEGCLFGNAMFWI